MTAIEPDLYVRSSDRGMPYPANHTQAGAPLPSTNPTWETLLLVMLPIHSSQVHRHTQAAKLRQSGTLTRLTISHLEGMKIHKDEARKYLQCRKCPDHLLCCPAIHNFPFPYTRQPFIHHHLPYLPYFWFGRYFRDTLCKNMLSFEC
ncbi:hypothetical protein TNCV_2450571 [Trichonephila clavipes]|nr:hypothetical protein TNCV_2450571 [Trichonephila clavipes]